MINWFVIFEKLKNFQLRIISLKNDWACSFFDLIIWKIDSIIFDKFIDEKYKWWWFSNKNWIILEERISFKDEITVHTHLVRWNFKKRILWFQS